MITRAATSFAPLGAFCGAAFVDAAFLGYTGRPRRALPGGGGGVTGAGAGIGAGAGAGPGAGAGAFVTTTVTMASLDANVP